MSACLGGVSDLHDLLLLQFLVADLAYNEWGNYIMTMRALTFNLQVNEAKREP